MAKRCGTVGGTGRGMGIGVMAAAVFAAAGLPASAQSYRTLDGTGNNAANTVWGSTGLTLSRMAGVNYADGIGSVDASRANPRDVSNAVFASNGPRLDQRGLSEINWLWGQFISHDISHTLFGSANGTLGITIPNGDPFFDSNGNNLAGQDIGMSRSEFRIESGARQQVNNITAWIDAGTVYGGRATDGPAGTDRGEWLRSFSGGKLKVSSSAAGDMMPLTESGAPGMANAMMPGMGANTFVAGDVRANEHVGLIGMHTLFVREHNRLADAIAAADASLTDQQIYDRARKIVGAQMQVITYEEYLPSLGVDMGSYSGYDASVDPSVTNEFSTAGFRLGHSQVTGLIQRLNADGSVIGSGNLDLVDAFFNPGEIYNGGLEATFLGLLNSTQESTDASIVDGLRNQLFERFVPGTGLVTDGTDLASLNILRGRDHGLGLFNDTREAYGLSRIDDWSELTSDAQMASALASVYGTPDEMDLWVGMLAQDPMAGASISETIAAILEDQFGRLRAADRFWYEHDLAGVNSDLTDLVAAFDGENLMTAAEWLSGLTLGEVMSLNTDATFTGNVFFQQVVPAPGAACVLAMAGLAASRRRRSAATPA